MKEVTSPDEKRWRREDDARILADAAAIKADKERYAEALKGAREIIPRMEKDAKAQTARAKALARIAKKEMNDSHVRTLNFLQGSLNDVSVRWFMGFGSVLYFIRDRNLKKPYEWDYDACVFPKNEAEINNIMLSMESNGFILEKQVINDVTKCPFQLVYKHKRTQMCADLFMMFEAHGYYWHTYDYKMEFPANGIPSSYFFKGVGKEAFEGTPWKYVWEENIPPLYFPCKYGTLLDVWYPGWYIPDSRFGQSRYEKMIEVPNCIKLIERLI